MSATFLQLRYCPECFWPYTEGTVGNAVEAFPYQCIRPGRPSPQPSPRGRGRTVKETPGEKNPDVSGQAILRGRYAAGRYLVAGDAPRELVAWISGQGFARYEEETHLLRRHGRRRNRLYSFHLPAVRGDVVMKVFQIDPRYKRSRRLDLLIRRLLGKDYNRNAFLRCHAMREAGLPVARPLAYWSHKGRGLFGAKSFFLYEKIPGEQSLADLCRAVRENHGDDTERLLTVVREKVLHDVRRLHEAGFRHGDPQTINILADTPDAPSARAIERATFTFIDYDRSARARVRVPFIKKFFDLRDLRVLYIDRFGPHQLLDAGADGKQAAIWHTVLSFWQYGGFTPWRSRLLP